MFYHIQGRRSYVGYQRLGRRLYEIVVDGGTPVFARNARALTDDAARIACSLEDADRLPYLLPNPIRASNVNEQIRIALRQRDLTLYPLPSIDAAQSFADQSGWGLGFAQGKPLPAACLHQYLNATVVPIDNIEQANVWLGKLTKPVPWTLILQHTGHLDQMTLNASGDKCRTRLAELLAEGVVHAYQMPCRSGNRGALAEAKTPEEYLPVEGPGNRKATLGPHDQPGYVQKPRAPQKAALPAAAKSLNEAEQRLRDARPAIERAKREGKPLPQSPFTLEDKQALIEQGLEENIMVRVIPRRHAKDDGWIGRPTDAGHSYSFSAPLSLVEHGDTDPEALLNAFGTRYDPKQEYTILIIDLEKMAEVGDVVPIIPTYENLYQLIEENPQLTRADLDTVKATLNDDFAPAYRAFAEKLGGSKVKQSDENAVIEFAEDLGYTNAEAQALLDRHQIAQDISTWEIFTGNGMTLDTNSKNEAYGPVEMFTYDRKPMLLGDLESSDMKAIKRLEAKPISPGKSA